MTAGVQSKSGWTPDLTDLELAALLSGLEHVLSRRGSTSVRQSGASSSAKGSSSSGSAIPQPRSSTCSPARHLVQAGKREKVLLRVFCHAYGRKVVLLLNGYDKAGDPSDKRQQREITLAAGASSYSRSGKPASAARRGGGRDS